MKCTCQVSKKLFKKLWNCMGLKSVRASERSTAVAPMCWANNNQSISLIIYLIRVLSIEFAANFILKRMECLESTCKQEQISFARIEAHACIHHSGDSPSFAENLQLATRGNLFQPELQAAGIKAILDVTHPSSPDPSQRPALQKKIYSSRFDSLH